MYEPLEVEVTCKIRILSFVELEARTRDKRPKGRPRKTWLDCLKEAGKRKNLSEGEMKKLSKDRKKWRQSRPLTPLAKKGKSVRVVRQRTNLNLSEGPG